MYPVERITSIMSTTRKARLIRAAITWLFTLVAVCGIFSCAAAMENAQEATRRAEEEGRRLEEMRAPENITLAYRIHMKKAQAALEKKKWAEAQEMAEAAEKDAQRIIETREALAEDLKSRLEKLKKSLETKARPRKSLVTGYFDALEALENHEYEKADVILTEVETMIMREIKFKTNDEIIVQAPIAYYDSKGIPLYESVSDDGTPGKIIVNFNDAVKGEFLGSKLISRDKVFVRISVYFNQRQYRGWVEGRFVQ